MIDYTYQNTSHPFYTLDANGMWEYDVDQLSSMKDGLTQYIDLQNSFYSTRRTWAHNSFVNLQYSILENSNEKLWLYVRFPMRMATEKLDYQRERTDTLLRRHLNFFEPDLKLKYYPKVENRDIFSS